MEDETETARLTARIVGAYVANNVVQPGELSSLVGSVHASLGALGSTPEAEEELKPAVPVRRSIKEDHLICLECGLKFSSLKLHLRTAHDMTPEEYRAKWGLKPDYPMVAPKYSNSRSQLAKRIGGGELRIKRRIHGMTSGHR